MTKRSALRVCRISDKLDALMADFKTELVSLFEKQLETVRDELQADAENMRSRLHAECCMASTSISGHESNDRNASQRHEDVGSSKHITNNVCQDEEEVSIDFTGKHAEVDEEAGGSLAPRFACEALHTAPVPGASTAALQRLQRRLSPREHFWVGRHPFQRGKHLKALIQNRNSSVFNPNHALLKLWGVFVSNVTLVCLWTDSLAAVESFPGGYGPFGFAWEVFLVCVFGIDILINFNTAVEDKELAAYDYRRHVIAKEYLRTWFLLDFLTAMPWNFCIPESSNSVGRLGRFAKIFKVMKAFRIARLAKLAANNQCIDLWDGWLWTFFAGEDGTSSLWKFTRFFLFCMKFLAVVYVHSHILACVVLATRNDPSLQWSFDGLPASDLHVWERIVVSFSWAIRAVATGGTGDYRGFAFSDSNAGVVLLKASAALAHSSVFIFALCMITNFKGSEDMDFNFKIHMMKVYLRGQARVTHGMRRKVISHLNSRRHASFHGALREMIGNDLSNHLRYDLLTDIYGWIFEGFVLLQQFPFTSNFGYKTLIAEFCNITTTDFFTKEERIISEGEKPTAMVFVISGRIRVQYTDAACPHRSFTKKYGDILNIAEQTATAAETDFFAVECLFEPPGLHVQSEYDLISQSECEIGRVTRRSFDKMLFSSSFPSMWLSFIQYLRSNLRAGAITASELQKGVNQEVIKKWEETQFESRSTSLADLGVAYAYLQSQFGTDLIDTIGQRDLSSTTFEDLGKYFWTDGIHRGFRGSAQKICPHDGLKGSSIVDALDDNHKGSSTFFVSWCWRYTVDTVLSALVTWVNGQNVPLSRCFFWMCFFCNNQRKLLVDQEPHDLAIDFGERLNRIGKMVMIFDNYHKPIYTQRIWCIYEVFTASKNKILCQPAMPQTCQDDFYTQLAKGNLAEIIRSLTNISVESADATHVTDKDQILRLIKNSIGVEAVNESVKCAMMGWLTSAFQGCLRQSVASEAARFVERLILRDSGHASEINCNAWKVAVERHPGLLDLFEFDASMSPEETFQLLCGEGCQQVNIQVLDSYLEQRNKNTTVAFAKWLHDWFKTDSALEVVHHEVNRRVLEEVEALHVNLQEHKTILKRLRSSSVSNYCELHQLTL